MASNPPSGVPIGSEGRQDAALQHRPWQGRARLASGLARIEAFLGNAGFDRAPWLVAALAAGIAAWFVLPGPIAWLLLVGGAMALAGLALGLLRAEGNQPFTRQALAALAIAVAAGCLLAWSRSAVVGTVPIARPLVATFDARVLAREDRPAEQRLRLVLALREPGTGRAIKVRVNLAAQQDRPGLGEGARIGLRARLMPPASPMLPGGYDFARAAWFSGLAATGSALGPVEVREAAPAGGALARWQRALSAHVRANLGGSPGTIAAAFASGDRGAIAPVDDAAMRDAGLSHLLSISGLHVSAVIGAAYVLVLRVLALLPWLALRVRLPLVAAAAGAGAGIGYTLLTGAEVPTIRSCIGAVLVLLALVLGREPLSLRMVAVAAALVLLVWPEALVGPSFQMSFAAVIAIVALHGAAPVRALFAGREEPWWARGSRQLASLLLTGVVIELALLPIGLFHFHRAGVYGALANVVAIPLTTLASMPLIALALVFDLVGAGAPFWWLAGKSLEALLWLAHATAGLPGAVTTMPAMGRGAFALFLAGAAWLALWSGRVRLWGLGPAMAGAALLATMSPPDLLVSGDGRHVAIVERGTVWVLRDTASDFVRSNLVELAGIDGEPRLLADWPGALCNADFCTLTLARGGRSWDLLIARGREQVHPRALAAACDRVDIVIADRWLPGSCRPRWFKADRGMLRQTGGLALDLENGAIRSVADEQGSHPWWLAQQPGRAAPRGTARVVTQ